VAADRDLTGVYTKWKTVPEVTALEFYAFYESNMVGGADESRNLFGARTSLFLSEAIDLGAAAASHAGSGALGADGERHLMLVATAGYIFTDFSKLRIGYEYKSTSRHDCRQNSGGFFFRRYRPSTGRLDYAEGFRKNRTRHWRDTLLARCLLEGPVWRSSADGLVLSRQY
jgi:hypothetical protein